MKKNRYGNLTNIINSLYTLRKEAMASYGVSNDHVAIQKALSLAFDISYERPVQDEALKDLAAACYNLEPRTMELIKALKIDAIRYYPDLVQRLNTYLVWS